MTTEDEVKKLIDARSNELEADFDYWLKTAEEEENGTTARDWYNRAQLHRIYFEAWCTHRLARIEVMMDKIMESVGHNTSGQRSCVSSIKILQELINDNRQLFLAKLGRLEKKLGAE